MSNTFKGFAAGIIAAIFYGTNPLGTLFLYQDEINPTSVLDWRYAIASLLFLAWMIAKRESFHLRLGPAIRMAVLGTFMAMSSATLYLSFKYMDAGIASTILFSYPIITAVLMTAFFHERITWSTTFSILLAVTGIGLLYRGGDNATLSTVGVALVLLSSLFYAFYIIGVNPPPSWVLWSLSRLSSSACSSSASPSPCASSSALCSSSRQSSCWCFPRKRRTSRATRSVLCEPSVADAFSPLVLSAAWAAVVCPALPYYCFRR